MSTLTLNLFENAVDSLDEALKKYQAAQEGDTKAYKFWGIIYLTCKNK